MGEQHYGGDRAGNRPATRRGVLSWLGRASAGLVASSIAFAISRPAQLVGASAPDQPIGPAPRKPALLPAGQRAAPLRECGSCNGYAEYVCSNCCVGNVCCSGNLYRQLCYDYSCRPYYTYWCA